MSINHPEEFDYSYYDYSTYDRSMHSSNSSFIAHGLSCSNLTRLILVILLRVGFVLIHVGSVPINNVNLILLQNLVDFCWVTIAYILVGYIVAYNGDVNGVIGEGYWIGDADVDKESAIIGWAAVVIAAAICTCGIVGRTHTIGYLFIGLILSALMQPLVIHWTWTPKGWMRRNSLQGRDVQFQDYAGSAVVHLVGGLSGLIGCMTLGRRILQLGAIDDASIAVGSSGTVFAGQFLVFVGLQSLSILHVPKRRNDSNVYINNLLAASTSSLLVVAFHFVLTKEEFNHWTVMRCIQAAIAGLVIISAGAEIYTPQAAIGLASTGSVVFYLVSRRVFYSALEDYCNIVAIHVVCAALGSLLAPFFKTEEDRDVNLILLNFSWQLICLIIIIALVTITMCTAFTILRLSGLLRNRTEYLNHMRASITEESSSPRSFLQRLFFPEDNSIYLQPGSSLMPDRIRTDQREGVAGDRPGEAGGRRA